MRPVRKRDEQWAVEQFMAYLRGRWDEDDLITDKPEWQNGFAERWIGSLRRDCLGHVIAINERQLRRVIRSYVDYYHADRTHLGLEKDAPEKRPIEPREIGAVVAFSWVGGLHHRYTRELQRAA
jgi:hypothetical protein